MSYIKVTDQEISQRIQSAIIAIYEVEEINNILSDDETSLCENKEQFKLIVDYIKGLKKEYKEALHKYDDLSE